MRNIFTDNEHNKEDSAFLYKMITLDKYEKKPFKMIIKLLEYEPDDCASKIKFIYNNNQEKVEFTDKPVSYWERFDKEKLIEVVGYDIDMGFIRPNKLLIMDAYEIYNENYIANDMKEQIKLGFSFKENMKDIYKMKAVDFSRNLVKHLYFMVMERAITFGTANSICNKLKLGKVWKKMWANGDGTASIYIEGLEEDIVKLSTILGWIINELTKDAIVREKIGCQSAESLIKYLNNYIIPYAYDYSYSNLINCDNVVFTDNYIYYRDEESETDIPCLFAIPYNGKLDKNKQLLPWTGEIVVEGIDKDIFYSEHTKCLYCNSPYDNRFYKIYADVKKVENEEGKIIAITGVGRKWYEKSSKLYYKEFGKEIYVCDIEDDKIYEVYDNYNIIVEPKDGSPEIFEPYKYNVRTEKYSINAYRTNAYLWKKMASELFINKEILTSPSLTHIMFIEESNIPPKEFNVVGIKNRLLEFTHEYYSREKVNNLLRYIEDNNQEDTMENASRIDLYNKMMKKIKDE